MSAPRIAFFPDSDYDANGVARTATALETYAAAHGWPMLIVHGGPTTRVTEAGSIVRLELRVRLRHRFLSSMICDSTWRCGAISVEPRIVAKGNCNQSGQCAVTISVRFCLNAATQSSTLTDEREFDPAVRRSTRATSKRSRSC